MAGPDWSLLQTPDFAASALAGLQAGRQQRGLNALKNYATDPAGTMNALIASGQIDQAAALSNFGYTQSQRQILDRASRTLFADPAAPAPAPAAPPVSTASPPAAQPSAASPAQPAGPNQADPRVASADLIDQTAAQIATLPYGQRKGALIRASATLTQAGLTQEQISAFDPTDDNLVKIHQQVAQARQQIATQPAGSQPASDAPSSAAAPAPTAGVSPIDLRNPQTVRALGLMTLGAPAIGSALTALGTATMPKYAPGRAGAPILDERTGKITGFAPTSEGVQYDVDASGNVTGAHSVPGYADAAGDYQATVKGKTTHAEHAAAAPYTLIEVPQPDGSIVKMTLDQFRALKASGQMPGLGQGPTPGAQEAQKSDAANYAKEVDAHGVGAITGAQNARTITTQALQLAKGIQPNAWTANTSKIADQLNAMGFKVAAPAANDISTYKALLPQVLRGTFTTFPRLEKEFEIVQKAAANVNTPKDAAQILLATQAAIQGRNLAYSNFVNNYQGTPSKQALTRAWLASPEANASIFADPIWRGVQIGGQPAVMTGNKPLPDGHVYGVFRPGTPYAQTFMVR